MEDGFEAIFDGYYPLLDRRIPISAAQVASDSGRIARAEPRLRATITDRLLAMDDTRHPPEHRAVVKGHAVEAFQELFLESHDKRRPQEFVRAQLDSTSPRNRKKAQEFLKRWADIP